MDVGEAVVVDHGVGAKDDAAGGDNGAAAMISVGVGEADNVRGGIGGKGFEPADRGGAGGMDVGHQHDGGGRREIKGRFESCANEHETATSFSAWRVALAGIGLLQLLPLLDMAVKPLLVSE